MSDDRLETKLIHAGEPTPRIHGAVSLPIFQSAMFEYAGETSYHDLQYIRLNNTPNHVALHAKLAALENAETALVMAAGVTVDALSEVETLIPGENVNVAVRVYDPAIESVDRRLTDHSPHRTSYDDLQLFSFPDAA